MNKKSKSYKNSFFYFTFFSFSTVEKETTQKMKANTNPDQLEEMQLRERNTLREQVNEIQGQLDEFKGEKFCYKTRIEKLETVQKKFAGPNSCSIAIQ